jgi:nitrogen fixation/metabolism regulation signal transduction histidine kinase
MVTNLKGTQKKLATSEKIAAWKIVGQKVAHEIKNPLTPIAISVDDLRKSYSEKLPNFDKTLNETTSTIKQELTRLTKLLEQFVSFARMNPPKIINVQPSQLIDEINNLYKNEIASGRLKIENKSTVKQINIDPETIKQVIINIIKNGFESSDDTIVSVIFENDDDNFMINVNDTGPGFNKEILKNSFTPYVTTKKDGSGLGLAICQRIIFDHNGTIEIYNTKEGGAGVSVKLPV